MARHQALASSEACESLPDYALLLTARPCSLLRLQHQASALSPSQSRLAIQVLYWRGSTTGGICKDDTPFWNMHRQRLVGFSR